MKWLLNELVRYHEEPLHINDTFDLNAMMTERFAGKVLQVAPVVVDAYVSSDNGDVTFGVTVNTTVTTPSSRSLTPVELPVQFEFTENYTDDASHLGRYEDDEMVFVIEPDEMIDFHEMLAENIIEQIPLKVLTPAEAAGDEFPQGNDWSVTTQERVAQQQADQVDPRFAKLKALFPDQDEGK